MEKIFEPAITAQLTREGLLKDYARHFVKACGKYLNCRIGEKKFLRGALSAFRPIYEYDDASDRLWGGIMSRRAHECLKNDLNVVMHAALHADCPETQILNMRAGILDINGFIMWGLQIIRSFLQKKSLKRLMKKKNIPWTLAKRKTWAHYLENHGGPVVIVSEGNPTRAAV